MLVKVNYCVEWISALFERNLGRKKRICENNFGVQVCVVLKIF